MDVCQRLNFMMCRKYGRLSKAVAGLMQVKWQCSFSSLAEPIVLLSLYLYHPRKCGDHIRGIWTSFQGGIGMTSLRAAMSSLAYLQSCRSHGL